MRQNVEGQGVHTGEIILEEIEVGDSVFFETQGIRNAEKKISPIGWEQLTPIPQEAAEVVFTGSFPKSIFNRKGGSPDGLMPEKMGEWEIGCGVVISTPLAMPYAEYVIVLCRVSRHEYVLLRSRQTRVSDRFE